jgi:hypothetical protein
MSGYAATPDQRPARERGLIALGADSCPDRQGDGLVELRAAAIGLPAGGTHVDDLDAARAEHRQLITAIEVSQHGVSVARGSAPGSVW